MVSGPIYVQKFVDKTGGIVIMQHRLKRWWKIPTIWLLCFAILFGLDIAAIDFSRAFDLFNLLETFASGNRVVVEYPAILPVIISMLGEGLKAVTRDQSDPDSPLVERNVDKYFIASRSPATPSHTRQRSTSLSIETSVSSKLLHFMI